MKIDKAQRVARLIDRLNKINTNILTLKTIMARGVGPKAIGIGIHCGLPGSSYFLNITVPSGRFDIEAELVKIMDKTLCEMRDALEKELETLE
jgi:hypothetical protein